MVRKSIDFELDIDSRKAQRNIEKTAKEARDLNEELEDTEITAGEAARAMVEMAGRAETELYATVRAVDALVNEVDGLDRERATQVIGEFKQLGFTAEQLEADIESVGHAVRAVDDINLKASQAGFDDITHAVSGVDRETRRARDTMTGFTGGMIGEMPIVADALGPVGEGLGQLAEGALEGEINFKQLLGAGLAMGGAVVVLNMLNSRLEESAKIKAFQAEQVDAYTDALEDADSVLEGVVGRLRQADELEFKIGGGIDFDVTRRDLLEVGLTAEQAAELIEGGAEKIDAWGQAAQQAGVDSETLSRVGLVLVSESKFLTDSLEAQAVAAEFFGDAAADAAESTDRQAASSSRLTSAVSDLTGAVGETLRAEQELQREREEQIETTQELLDLEVERTESQRAAIDSTFALRDAEEKFAEQLETTNEEIKTAGDDLGAVRQTMDDAASSAADLADAQLQLARDTANAEGKTLSASQELDVFSRSMLESARVAEGPARDAILEYVAGVNQIPAQKATEIRAAIERGDLDEAERLLNNASRSRRALITAQANVREAEGSLNYIGRPRTVLFYAKTVGDLPSNPRGPNVAFATGTKGARPNSFALVGEQGPELVDLPTGSRVRNAQETRRIMTGGNGSGGGTVINNWPAGVRPMDVAQATRRYERIQGPT